MATWNDMVGDCAYPHSDGFHWCVKPHRHVGEHEFRIWTESEYLESGYDPFVVRRIAVQQPDGSIDWPRTTGD